MQVPPACTDMEGLQARLPTLGWQSPEMGCGKGRFLNPKP